MRWLVALALAVQAVLATVAVATSTSSQSIVIPAHEHSYSGKDAYGCVVKERIVEGKALLDFGNAVIVTPDGKTLSLNGVHWLSYRYVTKTRYCPSGVEGPTYEYEVYIDGEPAHTAKKAVGAPNVFKVVKGKVIELHEYEELKDGSVEILGVYRGGEIVLAPRGGGRPVKFGPGAYYILAHINSRYGAYNAYASVNGTGYALGTVYTTTEPSGRIVVYTNDPSLVTRLAEAPRAAGTLIITVHGFNAISVTVNKTLKEYKTHAEGPAEWVDEVGVFGDYYIIRHGGKRYIWRLYGQNPTVTFYINCSENPSSYVVELLTDKETFVYDEDGHLIGHSSSLSFIGWWTCPTAPPPGFDPSAPPGAARFEAEASRSVVALPVGGTAEVELTIRQLSGPPSTVTLAVRAEGPVKAAVYPERMQTGGAGWVGTATLRIEKTGPGPGYIVVRVQTGGRTVAELAFAPAPPGAVAGGEQGPAIALARQGIVAAALAIGLAIGLLAITTARS